MNVLVIGSGGREHAMALKINESPLCEKLYCAPGNPGTLAFAENVPLSVDRIQDLLDFSKEYKIDLTVVGPEQPLVEGIVDAFQKEGLAIFGPTAAAARLEGSKAFSKDIMQKYNVPTAHYQKFTELQAALDYVNEEGAPIVVKASGLAAGKGAIVCLTLEEATAAVESMLGPNAEFGEAGSEVVIEEFMEGEEASIFAVCDGETYTLLNSAQDHKRVFDGDLGPNTGGMGAYSPAPVVNRALLTQVEESVIKPTLSGMQKEGCPYTGILYVGIMVTESGPRVVEYNCRLGDPEAQIVLPLYAGDFLQLLYEASTTGIKTQVEPTLDSYCSIVVLASQGYPGAYSKGKEITGLDEVVEPAHVIHAGTQLVEGRLVTNGGRVLGVVAKGNTLQECLDSNYKAVNEIQFEGLFYRKDIGQKGLTRLR